MFFPPRAYFFVGLNIVRALSIIGLILVLASNIVTVVHDVQAVNAFIKAGKEETDDTNSSSNSTIADDGQEHHYIFGSTVPNQPAGAFWAVTNRLLIIGQVLVLLMSEIGWPSKFFNRFFPILGDDFGLGALGIIQCLIGAAVLSHHVDDFTLVSAFFLFSIGCLNMLLGLIFRQGAKTKRSLTAWKDHAKAALPTHVGPVNITPMTSAATSFVSQSFSSKKEDHEAETSPRHSDHSGMGFGRQAEKAAGLKGFFLTKPLETLPRYVAKPGPSS